LKLGHSDTKSLFSPLLAPLVAGMAVHPGQGEDANEKVTLVNVLLHRYGREGLCEGEQEGDLERPGIVHRLDKDTSGLMIICKTNDAHAKLKEMFAKKSKKDDSADSSSTAPFSPGIALPSIGSSPSSETALKKTYWALVLGKVGALSGTIDTPLTRHAKQGHKMVATTPLDTKGKVAITHYKVLKYWHLQKQSYTLLEVNIETGRTHQIRVHMSSNAHPIVGDTLYATKHNSHNVPFLLLTSKELRFEHPVSKEKMQFSIELPDHFAQFISKLDAQQASFDKSNAAKKPKSLHNPYETNNEDLLI
jgi:23S rRNA pseudouridine1911/1915/1917 synthase